MSGLAVALLVLLAVLLGLAAAVGAAVGRLTRLGAALENAYARVDEALEHRHALVRERLDRLREAERDDVEAALERARAARDEARAAPGRPGPAADVRVAERALDETLAGTLAELPAEVADEGRDRLTFATEAFDEAVASYEAGRRRFPGAWVAERLGHRPAVRLGSDEAGG